jgi:membrane protease YdiL (CAAX protease family)
MFLKASFKNAPLFVQLLMLWAIVVFGIFFSGVLLVILILFKVGISSEAIMNVQQHLSDVFNDPDLMRGVQFFQTLGIFLLPAIVCAWLFSDNYKEYLHVDHPIQIPVAVWVVISMIVAIPFLNMTYNLNQQMVFPEALKGLETWMKNAEEEASQVTDLMLNTKNISAIVFNFLVICLVAAICEEFMFRGLLQTLFGKVIKNPHVLIWVIAILFSAIHFQFYGFVTRMLLGAWLGYLMYYTKTIWIPVLAHFTNNFFTVAVYYLFQNNPDMSQKMDALGSGSTWWLAVVSLALFSFCFLQIKKAINQ